MYKITTKCLKNLNNSVVGFWDNLLNKLILFFFASNYFQFFNRNLNNKYFVCSEIFNIGVYF